jgi:L-threonylcarbamoyladenylate synthase
MQTISDCTLAAIQNAAKSLKDGHLVAFPTETVYGLGADATNEKAVGKIYSVKARPADHPLIVHISSWSQVEKWARDIPEYAKRISDKYWPGPVTLVLSRSHLAKDFVTGGQNTVGLRIPDQKIALMLAQEFEKIGGLGIAAPSANKFGAVSPTTAEAVVDEIGAAMGRLDLILDDGECRVGVESTIVDCSRDKPSILRPGAVTSEMIEKTLNIKISQGAIGNQIRSPGSFKSHYAPMAKVALDESAQPGDGLIALASIPTPVGVIRLASPINHEEYANVLFRALRLGDQKGLKKIVVFQPEGSGLALAIRDRLAKAASG